MFRTIRLVNSSDAPGLRRVLDAIPEKGGRVRLILRDAVKYEPAAHPGGFMSETWNVFGTASQSWTVSLGKMTTRPKLTRFLESTKWPTPAELDGEWGAACDLLTDRLQYAVAECHAQGLTLGPVRQPIARATRDWFDGPAIGTATVLA